MDVFVATDLRDLSGATDLTDPTDRNAKARPSKNHEAWKHLSSMYITFREPHQVVEASSEVEPSPDHVLAALSREASEVEVP
mmetsp:Transcript_54018/g.128691  ORF Transcript_54018/g.128691 Transcript_54018/m.128691 type:complete len:82 (+) Transcript_54018:55-300(+)